MTSHISHQPRATASRQRPTRTPQLLIEHESSTALSSLPASLTTAPLAEFRDWLSDHRELLALLDQPGAGLLLIVLERYDKAMARAANMAPRATADEAATYWNKSLQVARAWIRRYERELDARKDGKSWSVDRRRLESFRIPERSAA